MKKVVFLLDGIGGWIEMFKNRPRKKTAFKLLSEIAEKRGLRIFYSKVSFYEKGIFKEAIYFDKRLTKRRDITPDAIHSRSSVFSTNNSEKVQEIKNNFSIINPCFFDYICDNKYLNYFIFSEYYPKTVIVRKKQKLTNGLFRKLRTKKLVIKPNIGSNGKDVRLVSKEGLRLELKKRETDVVIQEYIESAAGIPGIIKSVHDLRITVVNGKIFYAYIKIPRKKSFLCNVAQGGKMIALENSQIPPRVIKISNRIISRFNVVPNLIYSIDLARDKDGNYKLIEMNSRPGILFNKEDLELQKKYYRAITDNFLDFIAFCNS